MDSRLLDVVVGELGNVHSLLTQFADVAAEMPDVDPERAAGIAAGAALVNRRIRLVREQLLPSSSPLSMSSCGVRVLDPGRRAWRETAYGQDLLPVIADPDLDAGSGLSSGVTRLASGQDTRPRADSAADTVMVVLFGSVVVRWWDADGKTAQVQGLRHQHVHIPRGVPHAVSNPGAVPALLVVVRAAPNLISGVEVLPESAYPAGAAEGTAVASEAGS